MGQKNAKGSVSIVNASNRIRLRWRYQTKRYSLNLFLYNRANLLLAKKISVEIEQDMATGNFDETLKGYKPAVIQEEKIKTTKTLVDYFEEWVRDYRNMDCEKDIDYNSTRNMLRRWGAFIENTVVDHLRKETFGAKTYNRRLTLLKAFFQWTKKRSLSNTNPLEDVLPKKTNRAERSNRKPFSEVEIKNILQAFKNDTFCKCSNFKHSHYYPFLYFIFATGVRNAEAIGLRVQHIDLDKKCIHIREALARSIKGTNPAARIRKETKNGKRRVLPLTEDLEEVLAPLLQGRKNDDLVFQSPKGLAIDDNQFQKRIFKKVLQGLGIEHRVLYACRHTFGSRCIESGINPVMTAFLMGNNPETALRNYTHLISVPSNLPKVS